MNARRKTPSIASACRASIAVLAASWAMAAQSAEPAPPLEAYGDLPEIEHMALSPNGKGLAIIGRVHGERKLTVIEDQAVRAATGLGEAKLRALDWAGENMVTAVTSATQRLGPEFTTDKAEMFGVYLIPLDGGKSELVFARSQSLAKATFGNYGTRLVDGKWTGFYGGVELKRSDRGRVGWEFDHGRPALFAVDLATNNPRKIGYAPGESHWRKWLIDSAGKPAAVLDIDTSSGRWQIDNGQGAAIASGVDRQGDVSLIALGTAGTSLIYATDDRDTQERRWFETPLAGGAASEFLPGVTLERIYVDQTNGRIIGYLPRSGGNAVLFDPAAQATFRKVYRAFPKLHVEIEDWTPDFGHFLVRTSGNGDSGSWYLVDLKRMAADSAGTERPAIAPAQVGPISTVSYKAADGTALDGVLTLPPGRAARNLPVIVFPHGGPHAHDTASFDWWAQAFASRGYAVFQPNFRGSTNRDAAFMRSGYGQWGRKMQTDLSDGLAELVRQGVADPKRACIMGASYGGYAALAGVTLQNGLYRCAVAVAPVSDLADLYSKQNSASGDNLMVRAQLIESLGSPAGFNAVSPRRAADKADAPILLIHGKDDTVVGFDQSTAMAGALKRADKPHELVVLRQEDHWLSRPETRKQMLEAAMRFVTQHNPAD
ncbi:MAG: S9 family peptidase [Novosphingobium sp.]|nr:MAG: S9 family peptidase [Novosphingobium sp.]